MSALKLRPAAATLLLAAGLLLFEPCCESPPAFQSLPPVPSHIRLGDRVQERYRIYTERLHRYYKSVTAALKTHAPDLLPMLESPEPLPPGYQVLPRIIPDEPWPERPRALSAWYSWPWTDRLIDRASAEMVSLEMEFDRSAGMSLAARRTVYGRLAAGYRRLRKRQQNIDAHVQYNRLWQAEIAANRGRYDRETLLHDAVIERLAILDALKAAENPTLKRALAVINGIRLWESPDEIANSLIEREKILSREIHDAIAPVTTPPFVRPEDLTPRLRILHVPFYTDIEDDDFVRSIEESLETIWRLRDEDNEYRVELDISFIPVERLYAGRPAPQAGDTIDVRRHLPLFPPNRAILTTGALTTHVYERAIVLGPHDIAPRLLAHEFGHILGFKDTYIRGYRDLGKNGFQVMEIVAEPNDIMGAPGRGSVLRSHFERIMKHFFRTPAAAISGRSQGRVAVQNTNRL